MNMKMLCAVAVALAVCCPYGYAQYGDSSPGYASVGFDDPSVPIAVPQAQAQVGDFSAGYAVAGFAEPSAAIAVPMAIAQPPVSIQPSGVQPVSLTSGLDLGWDDNSGADCGTCELPCGSSCSVSGGACGGAPSWQFFGDFLYLRPRNAEVPYARKFQANPSLALWGRQGTVDYDFEPAYRAGFTSALNDGGSLGVTFTTLESHTRDAVISNSPQGISSKVSWASVPAGHLAIAVTGIDFDLVDMDYRGIMVCSDRHTLNYLVGVRYAYLEQGFYSQFFSSAGGGSADTVFTDIRFDGGGVRVGLEGERYLLDGCGLMVYGRGIASFVAGEFNARYLQDSSVNGTLADARYNVGRVISILDFELGAGWTLPGNRLRFSGGYLFSAWHNVLKTDDLIRGIRANNFSHLNGMLTFDGVVARAEYRF